MAKCAKCKQPMFPKNKCVCNWTSPDSSYNKSRQDSSKWCPKCSSRVINGKCMNAQCK